MENFSLHNSFPGNRRGCNGPSRIDTAEVCLTQSGVVSVIEIFSTVAIAGK